MKVKVLFFAQLREISGISEKVVELDESLKVGELTERLLRRPDGLLAMTNKSMPLLYAVNENFVETDEVLKDGDTLALMTPVAGG